MVTSEFCNVIKTTGTFHSWFVSGLEPSVAGVGVTPGYQNQV